MLARLFILAVLVGLALYVWRAWRDARRKASTRTIEDMVRCARCGMHVPRAEARMVDGKGYCSAAHARLGPA